LRISIPQDFIYDLPYLPSRSSLTLRSLTIDQIKETYKEAMANGLRTILYFPRLGIRYELRENVVEDKMEKTISIRKKIQRGNLTQEHLEPIETFLKRQQVYLSNQQYEVTRI
jgi:ribosome biogenesis GTPase A